MPSAIEEVFAIAQVKNGRLFIENRRVFDQQVALLDSRWTLAVTVRRQRATRGVRANRYWWGVCVQLVAEHTGYTPEEVHEIAKQMFIPKKLALSDGNGEVKGEFVIGGSTRTMNTQQFSEFVEQFKQWAAAELDIYIPDADEVAL
jgi:hypothetical protein